MRIPAFFHGPLLAIPGVSITSIDGEGRRAVETGVRGRRRRRVTYHQDTDGVALVEMFRHRGSVAELDAVDGPAYLRYDVEGHLEQEVWCRAGGAHRIGAPAVVEFRPDGTRTEEWFFEGERHRVDGPAAEQFDSAGPTGLAEWWLDGSFLSGRDELAASLGALPEAELLRWLEDSSYAELLREGMTAAAIVFALAGGVWSLDGIREVAAGAPVEWVASFESGETLGFVSVLTSGGR